MKRNRGKTVARGRLLLLLLCLPFPLLASADTVDPPIPAGLDLSAWVCQWCLFEQGFSGEVEVGAGFVSDDSFKFGEYNGLHDDGAYPIGNAMARYRDGDAGYLDLQVRDLGLDTRSVEIEGGRQGRYEVFLNYDGISHYISDSARTPYRGNGSDTLVLPPGWVTAGSTAGMTSLATSLQEVDLKTERKRLGIGIAFIPARKWETAVKVRHELRDGQKRTAGAIFFTNTAQLIEPVDYVTDEVEVSVTYTTRQWQSRLAYYGSFFNNHDASLTWDNAYTAGNTPIGRRALPPDNQFHQILLSSGYRVSEHTRVSGDIALGRMEQDETLLAATVNPAPSVTLPRSTADATVDTTTANLKVDSVVSDKLRLNAAYRYNNRDNRTPSESFTWVSTDAFFANTARANLPYSFKDNTVKLGGNYRLSNKTRLEAGYEYEQKDRTNQEVDKTREHTFQAKVSVRARDNVDVSLKAAHAERDASGYHPVAATVPPQNSLLRKYYLADRDRDTGSIQAGFSPNERINIGLGVDLAQNDYSDSVLGLTDSREISYNADVSVILSEETTLHGYASRQQIQSDQANSEAFAPPPASAPPDWFAKNEDTIDTFGIGVQHQVIRNRLDVGADYVLSRSTGEVSVTDPAGVANPDFPDLETDLDSLKLYADYRLKDNLTLHAAYWYENYDAKDWMLDGVAPATVSNVLSFGEQAPDYEVHAVMLSVRYRF